VFEGISLSRNKQHPGGSHPSDPSRRDFLVRFCQATGATFIPGVLGTTAFAFPPEEFHRHSQDGLAQLHPRYREQRPIDQLLLKVQPGLDAFITEKYAAEIEALLAKWSSGLLNSPPDVQSIAQVLAPAFSGCSLKPVGSRKVRSTPPVEVWQTSFLPDTPLAGDAFLRSFRAMIDPFIRFESAKFQIIKIDSPTAPPSKTLATRVRYELVGTGRDFYREQRIGEWDLDWELTQSNEYRLRRWRALVETQSRASNPVFVDITAEAMSGPASYQSQLAHGADYWRTVLDGASGIDIYGHNGVAVGDINNDGFDDLYICQPAGLPNRLYRNRGDGTFEDITDTAGVGVLENSACALFADIHNSGRQDLIVVQTNGPVLFVNEGGAKFRRVADAFQFAQPPQGTFTGASIADYDNDGWLDIYFCLYLYYQGTDQYKYPSPYYDAENGPPNFLMRNNRDGTFRDVTAQTGLNKNNTRYSFCCGWSDFNNDGWPDLCVVNDFGRKNLYRNNGDGTFTDVAPDLRVEDVGAGMSVSWFDSNNDGHEDLYVANMWTAAGERITDQKIFQPSAPGAARSLYRKHAMGNSLFVNQGSGKNAAFIDKTAASGVGPGRWSWASDAWDFDHDGYQDLYVTNGMVTGQSRLDLNSFFWRQVVANSPSEAKPAHDYEQGWSALNELLRADGTWSGFERNVFFANNADGAFSDVSGAVGLNFLEDGRAFALTDFDHDGRLEVFLKNRNAPQLRLLKNVIRALPPSIAFRLRGVKSNRDAIGAIITIQSHVGKQTKSLQAGSGFLSQHSKELLFGLGQTRGPVQVSVRWPSGLVQEFRDLSINHRVWLEEGNHEFRKEPFKLANVADRPAPNPQPPESLPVDVETWLLAPIAAPTFSLPDDSGQMRALTSLRGKPALLSFWAHGSSLCEENLATFAQYQSRWSTQGLQLLTVNMDDAKQTQPATGPRSPFPVLRSNDDVVAIYNILNRYLFDRHRDISLPLSFLIDQEGNIVKVYQGVINPGNVEQDIPQIPRTFDQRIAKALPFPGTTESTEFHRNYLSYGSVFFQHGYFEQAGAAFQLASQDNPSSAEALYGLGSVYLKQQKATDARQAFERAIKAKASYPETLPNAWNNLGLLAARDGRTDEAIGDFQKALRLDPDYSIAISNLGNAFRQANRLDDAQQAFERGLRVNPEDPDANYGLGMVFAQTNDTHRAEEHLQKAIKYRSPYPEALNNLAILYLRTERRDQAVATFEESIRLAPGFDQPYLNLARVYALEGSVDKARAVLQQLLTNRPGHPQAQKALDQLR
jgi:tetratricopeptide (TPR) repeat protein/peroxiredoxin